MKAVILYDDYLALHEGRKVEADSTHRISIDGEERTIDLTGESWSILRGALAPFWDAANETEGGPVNRDSDRDDLPPPHTPGRRKLLAQIRLWADGQGRTPQYLSGTPGLYVYPDNLVKDFYKANGGRERCLERATS